MANETTNQPTAEASGAVTFEQPLSLEEKLERDKQKTELANAEMFLMNKLNLTYKELLDMRLAIKGYNSK
jgi:hypothetical protein